MSTLDGSLDALARQMIHDGHAWPGMSWHALTVAVDTHTNATYDIKGRLRALVRDMLAQERAR